MTEFLFKSWAEFFFFVVMVIGVVIGFWAGSYSAFISYIVIFLSGMICGRLIYERKHNLTFPYYLIIIGFLIGFLLGTYYGSKQIVVILFVLGTLISYHLHNKGYIRDIFF
jgi:signal transduction histidine kinase